MLSFNWYSELRLQFHSKIELNGHVLIFYGELQT